MTHMPDNTSCMTSDPDSNRRPVAHRCRGGVSAMVVGVEFG
jgi:hypothetical protein